MFLPHKFMSTFPHSGRLRAAQTNSSLQETWNFGGRRLFILYFCLGFLLYMRGFKTASVNKITAPQQQVCKDILFVRHAEGIHNRDEAKYPDFHTSGRSTWPDYYDAPLTDLGRDQAKRFVLPSEAIKMPQLLVTSPLSRAIDTCLIAFPGYGKQNIVATDLCRERISKYTSDVRKSRTELEKLFPTVNFSLLQTDLDVQFETSKEMIPHEYNSDACKARAQNFVNWLLLERQEEHIAVITHWVFLQHLFQVENVASSAQEKVGNAQGKLVRLCRRV